jgi:transposase-like protein
MSEEQVGATRRRRSRAEAAQLVAEYEAGGLSREEFCRERELALSTLARYRKRRRAEGQDEGAGPGRWLAVELSGAQPAGASGLAVVLTGGRRIEVGRGFDARTLEQLVSLLEPA